MRTRTLLVALLVTAVLSAAALGQEVRLLNGFNTAEECDRFRWAADVKKELSRQHVTEGERSIKLTFPGNVMYHGFGFRDPKLMADWHKWDLLSFDVFNPTKDMHRLVIRIDDDRTDKRDWATWYTGTFKVFPGENHIEIEIAKLRKPHAKGRLNTDKLKQLALWTAKTKEAKVLYFDHFALRKFKKTKLPARLRAFDFGTRNSTLWPGFTRVHNKDLYTDARGYGLIGNVYRAVEDAPRAVEGLGKDAVGTGMRTPLRFTVKLRNGRYALWAATGYVDNYNWPRKPYTVKVAGRVVFEHKPKSLDPLEAADYLGREYSRSADLWKLVVVGHLFDEFVTDVTVRGGKLELVIESEGASRLRGLAVWPTDDRTCEAAMAKIHAARREAFHGKWREIRPAKSPAPPRTMPDEFNRGFFLVRRNLLEKITPYFRPKVEDRFKRIAIAATPGETASTTCIVYPVRNIQKCSISVKPLKTVRGDVLASENVKIHTVQYRYARRGEDAWEVQQGHLAPRSTLPLEPHVPRQFWLEVDVPVGTKPGVYSGSVLVSSGGVNVTGFVLAVEVYPFTLDRPEDHGVVYAHASRIKFPAAWIENDLRCLKRYGCNSITPSGVIGGKLQGAGGKANFTLDRLDLLMDLMKKVGMTGPVPLFDQSIQGYAGGASKWHVGWQVLDETSDWRENMTRLTRQIMQRAKEKDYLPVLMYPSTEISNDPKVGPRFNSEIIKAIRAAGKCQIISSVNRPADIVTAKELDHVMLNFGVNMNQATLDRVHASGAKLWFQNVGQTRYVDGLFMLRAGAIGHRQWVANWASADPYTDWDGGESNAMLFPSKVGTLPSIRLAQMAEGIKDMRYFLTLRRHIAEARKAGLAAAADAAQKEMDAMIATCPIQLPDGTRVFEDGLSVIEGFRDLDTFDRYRARAARQILSLRKAMGKR